MFAKITQITIDCGAQINIFAIALITLTLLSGCRGSYHNCLSEGKAGKQFSHIRVVRMENEVSGLKKAKVNGGYHPIPLTVDESIKSIPDESIENCAREIADQYGANVVLIVPIKSLSTRQHYIRRFNLFLYRDPEPQTGDPK